MRSLSAFGFIRAASHGAGSARPRSSSWFLILTPRRGVREEAGAGLLCGSWRGSLRVTVGPLPWGDARPTLASGLGAMRCLRCALCVLSHMRSQDLSGSCVCSLRFRLTGFGG